MRLHITRLSKASRKTVTVQRLWIKVQESPVPIPVKLSRPYELYSGDSLEVKMLADELIREIGTMEPELLIEDWV